MALHISQLAVSIRRHSRAVSRLANTHTHTYNIAVYDIGHLCVKAEPQEKTNK